MTYFDDRAWWTDLAGRVVGNEIQVLLPTLAVLAQGNRGLDLAGLGVTLVTVLFWTVVKNVAIWQHRPDAPMWQVALDRVGSAVAASVLVTVPEHFWGSNVQWSQVAVTVGGAALTATLMLFHKQVPVVTEGD